MFAEFSQPMSFFVWNRSCLVSLVIDLILIEVVRIQS